MCMTRQKDGSCEIPVSSVIRERVTKLVGKISPGAPNFLKDKTIVSEIPQPLSGIRDFALRLRSGQALSTSASAFGRGEFKHCPLSSRTRCRPWFSCSLLIRCLDSGRRTETRRHLDCDRAERCGDLDAQSVTCLDKWSDSGY